MTGTRIIETGALNVGWVRSSNIQAGQCDTTTARGKLILTVLAGLAEFERSLIEGGAPPASLPRWGLGPRLR